MPISIRQPLLEFGQLEKTEAFSPEAKPRGGVGPAFPGAPIYGRDTHGVQDVNYWF
jgi:hypothetical protein